MARIETCPQGHGLKLFRAVAGTCDGCQRSVDHGELVHDCRRCNWYLCDDCRPARSQIGDEGFWGVFANLFMGNGCGAEAMDLRFEVAEPEQEVKTRSRKGKGRRHGALASVSLPACDREGLPGLTLEGAESQEPRTVALDDLLKPGASDPSPASTAETCEPPEDLLAFACDEDTPKSSTDARDEARARDAPGTLDLFADFSAAPSAAAVGGA